MKEEQIKFMADVNIEKPIIDYLEQNGDDVKWITDYDPEMCDEELSRVALEENKILILRCVH